MRTLGRRDLSAGQGWVFGRTPRVCSTTKLISGQGQTASLCTQAPLMPSEVGVPEGVKAGGSHQQTSQALWRRWAAPRGLPVALECPPQLRQNSGL